MKIHSTSPDAYAVFFPFETEDTTTLSSSANEMKVKTPLIVQDEIISVDTYKPKTGSGTWSITLASSQNFRQSIFPGNWVMIYISDQALDSSVIDYTDQSGLKMLGIVKSVRAQEEVNPSTGVRTLSYTISGQDFHPVLEMQVYFCATLKTLVKGKSQQILDSIIVLGDIFTQPVSPNLMVKKLIDSILGVSIKGVTHSKAGMPFKIPTEVVQRIASDKKGNLFTELLEKCLQSNLVGETGIISEVGDKFSLWSVIQAYSNRILNEVYTELLPVNTANGVQFRPTVVLRALPLSSKQGAVHKSTNAVTGGNHNRTNGDITPGKGIHLYRSKSISEDEIVGINYGRSDDERFNFFLVFSNVHLNAKEYFDHAAQLSTILNGGLNINTPKVGDSHSITRYGLRPYIIDSNYMMGNNFRASLLTMNNIVRDMWKKSHLFDNGTVTIIGSSAPIPVGTNILFSERKWVAHIEGVGNSFSVHSNGVKTFRTIINFIRLQTEDGKPLSANSDGPNKAWEPGINFIKTRKK